MNKVFTIIISAVVILMSIVAGIFFFNMANNNSDKETKIGSIDNNEEENIVDDCTDEWEAENMIQNNSSQIVATNSDEEKISPNASLVLKRYYKQCGHVATEYTQVSKDLVNKTEEDVENQYPDWTVSKYSKGEIILYKECEGECGEHYMIRADNDRIIINKVDASGNETLYEETDIYLEYVTDEDKQKIEKGLEICGREELNQYIEDFE